jgi:acyl dehydratase
MRLMSRIQTQVDIARHGIQSAFSRFAGLASDPVSLIEPETRALVGKRLGEPLSVTIGAAEAERFAYAAGDTNPIYFDDAAARAAGYRARVVPPGLLVWALEPPRPLEALREDGLPRDAGPPLRLRVSRVLYAGEEWEYHAPVHVGDTIRAETRLASLEEKTGGSGPFVLVTTETTYMNQAGETVAVLRGRRIAR